MFSSLLRLALSRGVFRSGFEARIPTSPIYATCFAHLIAPDCAVPIVTNVRKLGHCSRTRLHRCNEFCPVFMYVCGCPTSPNNFLKGFERILMKSAGTPGFAASSVSCRTGGTSEIPETVRRSGVRNEGNLVK